VAGRHGIRQASECVTGRLWESNGRWPEGSEWWAVPDSNQWPLACEKRDLLMHSQTSATCDTEPTTV